MMQATRLLQQFVLKFTPLRSQLHVKLLLLRLQLGLQLCQALALCEQLKAHGFHDLHVGEHWSPVGLKMQLVPGTQAVSLS